MPIDIQKMFSDLMPNPETEDILKGELLASNISNLGSGFALQQPAVLRSMRRGAGNLLGVDTRTPAERLQEQLKGVDMTTPAGQQQAIEIINQVDPTKALQLKVAMQEQARAQQIANADTTRAEAARVQANAQELNALTNQENLDIERNKVANVARQIDLGEQELAQQGVQQEDLRTWRNMQNENALRQFQIDEEANRIRLEIANMQREELGSRDRAAIREATSEAWRLESEARAAMNIANEYTSLLPMSGAAALLVDKWKSTTGSEDEVSALRAKYTALRNSAALSSLPPGAASDTDVSLALQGFLPATANAQTIADFMQGMGKVAAIDSLFQQKRAEYLADNKGIDTGFRDEWEKFSKSDEFKEVLNQRYGVTFNDGENPEIVEGAITQDAIDAEIQRQKNLNSQVQQGLTL